MGGIWNCKAVCTTQNYVTCIWLLEISHSKVLFFLRIPLSLSIVVYIDRCKDSTRFTGIQVTMNISFPFLPLPFVSAHLLTSYIFLPFFLDSLARFIQLLQATLYSSVLDYSFFPSPCIWLHSLISHFLILIH